MILSNILSIIAPYFLTKETKLLRGSSKQCSIEAQCDNFKTCNFHGTLYKDMFSEDFDSILNLDNIEMINYKNEIKHDFIQELLVVDMKYYKNKCIQQYEKSFPNILKRIAKKIRIKLDSFFSWIGKAIVKFYSKTNSFTNDELYIIIIENIFASIFVMVNNSDWIMMSIIIWLILNYLFFFSQRWSMALKIILLFFPTVTYLCVQKIERAKQRISPTGELIRNFSYTNFYVSYSG